MIISSIARLRDPFVLLHDGYYYVFGTGWVAYRGKTLDGEFESLGRVVTEIPDDDGECEWAPEVHYHDGKFYMFTTYKSKITRKRGCTIFCADKPEGPYKPHSDGFFTPKEWDSIDATFYVDENGDPWSVFVHEWTSTDDGIGRMCSVRLTDDLRSAIGEPKELFRADDPSWTNSRVTDGCFMHRCENGELLMIWSNFCDKGYCVGIARSDNGKPDGNFSQDDKLLFTRDDSIRLGGGNCDGGHGMLFRDKNGELWLSIHSPNDRVKREETPVFIRVNEHDGELTLAGE